MNQSTEVALRGRFAASGHGEGGAELRAARELWGDLGHT